MLLGHESYTVGKPVFLPFKWCHIHEEHAFVGWAAFVRFAHEKYDKSPLPMPNSSHSPVSYGRQEPAMTALHRQAHLHWNLNMWSNIMFSDETRFCLRHMDCRVTVWRRRRERFADCCTDRVTCFSGGSVMGWGFSSLTGRTRLLMIGGNLNAERYWDEILQPVAVPYLNSLRPNSDYNALPTERGYQRLPPEFGSGEDGMAAVLTSTPSNSCGISLGCCQSDQHNHVGWPGTHAGWRMGGHPTTVCEQAGDQHEEKRLLWLWLVVFIRLQSSNPPNPTKRESGGKKAVWHWRRRFVTFFMGAPHILSSAAHPHKCLFLTNVASFER